MAEIGDEVALAFDKQSCDVGRVLEVDGNRTTVCWEVLGRTVYNYGPGEIRVCREAEAAQRRAMREPGYDIGPRARLAKIQDITH